MPRKLPRPHERLQIGGPCSAEWDSMAGNERVRFCAHCSLHVHNLSETTPAQASQLVRRSGGRLCLRVERDPGGVPRTRALAEPLYQIRQIRRRVSRFAAGAFGAALTLCSAAAAQAQTAVPAPARRLDARAAENRAREKEADSSGSASLDGTVTDPYGAAIPATRVTLKGDQTGAQYSAATDDDGAYSFAALPEGTYTLTVEREGFTPSLVKELKVQSGSAQRSDVTLQPDFETATVGVVAVVVEPSEPLVKAAKENDLEAVRRLLLFGGADVNVLDKQVGVTALAQAFENNNRELVQELLWRGARANERLSYRQTALMRMNDSTSADIVRELLDAGAKVNMRDEEGNTALMFAAEYGRQEVVELLLRAGAKVNARSKTGATALMNAAQAGATETVRALLLAGADLSLRDEDGHSALWHARDNEHEETASLLLAFGAYEEPEEKQ
ncbi:MAG TPA: ankyrin repeat domain-containing protein [Pyrinomonadaceae bacterium]|nr:ankyrin repeat domain-containing protein [Pyrinomonadaceae bacterium]